MECTKKGFELIIETNNMSDKLEILNHVSWRPTLKEHVVTLIDIIVSSDKISQYYLFWDLIDFFFENEIREKSINIWSYQIISQCCCDESAICLDPKNMDVIGTQHIFKDPGEFSRLLEYNFPEYYLTTNYDSFSTYVLCLDRGRL